MGILTAVDVFSGFVIAQSVKAMTANVSVQFLVNHVILSYGLPRVMHSDNGTHFAGLFEIACD